MDLDNIIKEYGVPMASGVHMEYPQTIRERKRIYRQPFYTVAEPVALGQEQVIEQMSGADGITTASQNAQVRALEDLIDKTTKRQGELNKLVAEINTQIDYAQSNYDTFDRYTTDCKKKLKGFTPTYECKDGHQVIIKTHEAELKQKSEWSEKLKQYKKTKDIYIEELNKINEDLPKLQDQLTKAREEAAVASMTPEQKSQYEVNKRQAEAQAEATRIKAEAEASSIKSKSKIFLIVGIAAGIALIGGLTFYFIKGRKKGIPTPVVKPVAPVIK